MDKTELKLELMREVRILMQADVLNETGMNEYLRCYSGIYNSLVEEAFEGSTGKEPPLNSKTIQTP
ncbi:hypothetical protein [Paenibacillus cineris]|uniref:hypothetical protein n=1 Tax=Paenibacillus cineris TaxID=237530 RepID=UPI001B23AA34|nr:hypothetical protein [Paenibacillus cineris]GIO63568.1 hypothetical protein J43TS9_51420 [Paenibacillus cineris]